MARLVHNPLEFPFGIPAYEYSSALTPRIRKCTMCHERVFEKGGRPGCVEACPAEVMTFGRSDELVETAQKRIADNPGRYVNHIYGEGRTSAT